MRFCVLSLFPHLIQSWSQTGLVKQAFEKQQASLKCLNPRDFTTDNHKSVDARPVGGGAGMVMKAEPLSLAIKAAKTDMPKAKVVLLSPQGSVWDQSKARDFYQNHTSLVLVCGRYSGVDERLVQLHIDEQISIGNFILNGGELAACVLMESLLRFVPGVLGNPDNLKEDSFGPEQSFRLLGPGKFALPKVWQKQKIPSVLFSGHRSKIQAWKKHTSLLRTYINRPELLQACDQEDLTESYKWAQTQPPEELDTALSAPGAARPALAPSVQPLEAFTSPAPHTTPPSTALRDACTETDWSLGVALVHWPVTDRAGTEIVTNITNLDVHDIARSCSTYGVERYFILNPLQHQLRIVSRVLEHWRTGEGSVLHPSRRKALENVRLVEKWGQIVGRRSEKDSLLVVGTSARAAPSHIGFNELKNTLQKKQKRVLLVFGTGYGLTRAFLNQNCCAMLPPLQASQNTGYNHLCVRSAVSIVLDRLLGA